MSKQRPSASKTRAASNRAGWSGKDRRAKPDRREALRRIDQRRMAGIGEVMDDRREQRGRRKSDRRAEQTRRASDNRNPDAT